MAASATANGDDSEDTVAILTDFYAGLFLVDALVRRLLPLLEGYECKSPEKGKFTLAFRCAGHDGVRAMWRGYIWCYIYMHTSTPEPYVYGARLPPDACLTLSISTAPCVFAACTDPTATTSSSQRPGERGAVLLQPSAAIAAAAMAEQPSRMAKLRAAARQHGACAAVAGPAHAVWHLMGRAAATQAIGHWWVVCCWLYYYFIDYYDYLFYMYDCCDVGWCCAPCRCWRRCTP